MPKVQKRWFEYWQIYVIVCVVIATVCVVYVGEMIADKMRSMPDPGRLRKILPWSKDPADAIGRTQFANAGCSATITGPIASDDKVIHILTAAHCQSLNATGTMRLKDGRTFGVRCVARDPKSDVAWLIAHRPEGDIPNVALATTVPTPGAPIWHQGYGIDKPNNREPGTFRGTATSQEQYVFDLSVSPGDSGGGIVLNAAGEVLSPVCCTTRLSGRGTVWGGTSLAAAKIRPLIHRPQSPFEVHHPMLDFSAQQAPPAADETSEPPSK